MQLTFPLISSTLAFSEFKDFTVACTSANLVCLYSTPSHLSIFTYVIDYLQLYYTICGLHTTYYNHCGGLILFSAAV